MNKKFMDFMRSYHNDVAEQSFKMTVVRSPPAPASSPASSSAPSTPGPSTSNAGDEDEWQAPTPLDATEPRLAEEAATATTGASAPAPGTRERAYLLSHGEQV